MNNRKSIPDRVRNQILKRDKYTCTSCGKSPAFYPELDLEVDHILPFSKGGSNDPENLQTLCILCNRGKGNDPNLNMTLKNKIYILLDKINPEILKEIQRTNFAKVVANDTDYQELKRLNDLCHTFELEIIPNTIIWYQAWYNMWIYTLNDNCTSKVNFILKISKI